MGALFFEKKRVSGKSGDGFCYKEKTAWTIIGLSRCRKWCDSDTRIVCTATLDDGRIHSNVEYFIRAKGNYNHSRSVACGEFRNANDNRDGFNPFDQRDGQHGSDQQQVFKAVQDEI